MDKKQVLLSIGEAADYLGISIDTLRRWEKRGKIEAYRSPGNHRYFDKADLDNLFGRKYERKAETKPRNITQTEEASLEGPQESPNGINKLTSLIPNPEFIKVLDRQVKEVQIPQVAAVRIIQQETVETQTVAQTFTPASQGESILLPQNSEQNTTPNTQVKPGKTRVNKRVNLSTILIVIATVILVTMAGIIVYMVVVPPHIASPVPHP